jgi:UDP-glucose 4-epimerase
MRLLVTGAAGFIGSHLAARLIRDGHHVLVVDNLTTGSRRNVPSGADFLKLDLAHPDFAASLPAERFDAVCHLAAQSSGEISGENPLYDVQVNALSTLELSRWAVRQKIPRFLYASSMAVYGNPKTNPVPESASCEPLSFYGISKWTSEQFLRLATRDGISSTSFRMFSVYGPGQNMENLKQGMASIFMAYMLKRAEVPVKGSLSRFRDFIYIDDVIDAWTRAVKIPCTPLPVYNLGSGRSTTVAELLVALKATLGLPVDYPVQELPGSEADQFGLCADIKRSQSDLDWRPRTSLEEGLSAMARWVASSVQQTP